MSCSLSVDYSAKDAALEKGIARVCVCVFCDDVVPMERVVISESLQASLYFW
jgi:hypothetical protein